MKNENLPLLNPHGKIVTRYIEDELTQSYLTYAMSVNTNRAIPDVRDGLKPSTRRIIYAMGELGLKAGKSYDKCAAVVGEVMKNFHPHGDGPIYNTLVGLVQEFGMRYPIVDGQGNFGSIDDDPPGAMRYTECRLTKIAAEMLADLHKSTVDFQPNYKESILEPTVLTARLPNLMVNGTTGIGVGYLTRIPPHNLSEVVDGILMLLDNPEVTISELNGKILAPDFPTAGLIIGRSGIEKMYATGRGSITMRSRARIEHMGNGKDRIIITEIPFQLKKNQLLKKMSALVASKQVTGISDLRDESDQNIRIVIELKRGEVAQVILNQLYKHTKLQTNFNAILLCLVDGVPKVLNLKQLLHYYLKHRHEVVRRRTQFDLDRCEHRAHILEGYRIALDRIEEIIELVQMADSPQMAKEKLNSDYELSELQATEVLRMTLRQLTGLERQKINSEYADLIEEIARFRAILGDELLVSELVRKELTEMKEKYGDERRTEIIAEMKEFRVEDLVADEEMVVTISHNGYIKRTPISAYRTQRRGGVGVIGMNTKEDDFIEHIFVASMHQHILFFTSSGKCHWQKVFELPEGGRNARGRAIVNLLRLGGDEKITAFVPVRKFDHQRYVFMTTEKGIVKKCPLEVFSRPQSAGIIAISLKENDKLIDVRLTKGDHNILLVTRKGMSIHFSEADVRSMGRAAQGVFGIRLAEDDLVVGMIAVASDADADADADENVMVVTENGYGKRTEVNDYRQQKRGGRGIIAIKTSQRNGNVVAVRSVVDEDELILISSNGMITRMRVDEMRTIGRNTQGVRMMTLHRDETIVDVGKISSKV